VSPGLGTALEEMTASFERFCLAVGLEALGEMMEAEAAAVCGPRHGRGGGRRAQRWGWTTGPIGFHGGKVAVTRPRVRARGGQEVALSAERLAEWLAADLSGLDLLAVQIDGIHLAEELLLVAAVGIDGEGTKHPLGLVEGATENAAVVQALLNDLVTRGLDPSVPRLFIIDGAKALSKAIHRTFGRDTPIQRCQVHKACNIVDRLPNHLHASTRRTLRQAWELDDAEKAEKLLRNLARTLEREAPSVAGAILEGLDKILTAARLGLPNELRRSLVCTNIIENIMGPVRRIYRNVKRWRDASMALRWTAAAMLEAAKGFRRLKAKSQLPHLRAALLAHGQKADQASPLAQAQQAA
jgi:putative transposase